VLVYEMICGRSPFAGKGDLTELEIYSNITAYNNDLKWDDSIKVSPETKSFVERALTRDISKRLDAVSAYKDPWFIKGGVVWAKLAKGESTFTNSNEKVPLHEELSKIHKAWKSDAMLPEGEVKAVVDDEEWFAEF
jgi:serine/threonine protein kinase